MATKTMATMSTKGSKGCKASKGSRATKAATMFRKGSVVKIPGLEWPGTQWDVPNAWYDGTITRQRGDIVFVKFEDFEEPLNFRRHMLETYRTMYSKYLFDTLCDVCSNVLDSLNV